MRILFVLTLLSLIFNISLAQDDFDTLVRPKVSVVFKGNKRTKASYLSRFIQSSEKVPTLQIDSALLQEDLRRLRTLPGIMSAQGQVNKSDTLVEMIFEVEERWTLLPVGDFGISQDNYWIGAGAMEYNALGKGIYLYGYIQYKTPFALRAIIRFPYILGSNFGAAYQAQYFEAYENTSQLNYDTYRFEEHRLSGRYELVYEKELLFGVAHTIEKIESKNEIIDMKKSVRVLAEVKFQHLNYKHFLIDGWKNNFIFSYRIPYTHQKTSIDFYDELRYYKTCHRLNLACRLAYGLSTEEESYYMPYVIDNYKNIRGSGYRAYKGNQLAMLNVEGRFTLYHNDIGGIQAIAFTDMAKISSWIAFSTDHLNESLIYAGPGLRFIYKKAYNAVLSIDYGFDLAFPEHGGIVIGWGQYF